MLCSIIVASLAALVAAAPMDMENLKQAVDTSYGAYGKYAKYNDYGTYPGSVEEAAHAMANSKRDMMKTDVKPAADTSYGAYGAYGKYSEYETYPDGVEEASVRMKKGMMQ
ncbi:hypothetical protein EKO04_000288 [Ascochyta lentis]|uniref:Uncharacterized protein n=1 Tax=Ascochyta lentis TaxID=205686 RepID=A0A8H7JD54_9PLEO|nr:hypothetical protein EKO04_000288 [Ascochyta lentis]